MTPYIALNAYLELIDAINRRKTRKRPQNLHWIDVNAIKPYPQSPRRHVPGNIARPPYVGLGDVPETYDGSHVQSA